MLPCVSKSAGTPFKETNPCKKEGKRLSPDIFLKCLLECGSDFMQNIYLILNFRLPLWAPHLPPCGSCSTWICSTVLSFLLHFSLHLLEKGHVAGKLCLAALPAGPCWRTSSQADCTKLSLSPRAHAQLSHEWRIHVHYHTSQLEDSCTSTQGSAISAQTTNNHSIIPC